jgi:hypothetical protein
MTTEKLLNLNRKYLEITYLKQKNYLTYTATNIAEILLNVALNTITP